MLNEAEEKALERTDLILDGNVSSWDMRVEGDIQGTYSGFFKFKCYLTPLQQIAANREYRELMGPNPTYASEHESFLAYSLTQLKHRIISAPPFWASQNPAMFAGDIADENVISAVLDAALSSELKYKTQLKQKRLNELEKAQKSTEKMMEVEEDKDEETDESQDQENED